MTGSETRILVVAEYVDEIQRVIHRYGEDLLRHPLTCVLAFEPELQVYLKKIRVPYVNTSDFVDANSHRELASRSTELLAVIRDGLTIHDELDVSVGYERAFAFYARFFLRHLLFLSHVLHRACVHLRPERVIVAKGGSSFRRGPGLTRDERYLTEVARAVCREQGVVCDVLSRRGWSKTAYVRHLKRAVRDVGAGLLFAACDALLARRHRGRTLVIAPSKEHNLGRVFEELRPMLGPQYLPVNMQSNHLPSLLKQLVRDTSEWSYPGLRVWPGGTTDRDFESRLDFQMSRLSERVEASPAFRYHGLDLAQRLTERARTVLRQYMLELQAQTAELDRLLDRHRPDLVLSQFSMGWAANLGTLADRKGIPAMLIPHGSMVPSADTLSLAAWREHGLGMTHTDYRYLALQTPWTQAYLQQSPGPSTAVRTGPLLFSKPTRRGRRGDVTQSVRAEKTVLHVGTPKLRNSMRFWVYETADEYVKNVNSLIRAVERTDGYRLLIRFRSWEALKEDDFKALLVPSPCYEVCSSGSLSDYVDRSDLVVSYSSTAIEEALQLRMPVLQYDPQGKYCHVRACVLDPAVKSQIGSCYFVANEDHLAWALQWLLTNHLSSPQPDSLWDEHQFDTADGLRPFLETVGLVASAGPLTPTKSEDEPKQAAWIQF
jgi:hypothetical protein